MAVKRSLISLTQFNLWANQEFIDWFSDKDLQLFDVEIVSSFSSINKTLNHLWFAENIWIHRINGLDINKLISDKSELNFQTLSRSLIHTSRQYVDLVSEISESELNRGVTYFQTTIEKNETTSVANIIQHVMNHATYHRGQLVTLGRQLGFIDPPKTDFIQFLREKTNKS